MSAKKAKRKTPAKVRNRYNEQELCKDIALGEMTMAEIAAKHKISARQVYGIAAGESRPELKLVIDKLIDGAIKEAMRIVKARSRWAIARLMQFARGEVHGTNTEVAFKATLKCLELAGVRGPDPDESGAKRTGFVVRYR